LINPLEILDLNLLLFYVPLSIFFILTVGYLAGYIKLKFKIKTNYTRKLFHIAVFTFAGFIALYGSFEGVLIYGGISTVYIFILVYLGEGNILWEGIAREEDHPHRSLYIVLPLISTASGGILGQLLFGQFAMIGYFIVGLEDAAGEPVGVRFGRHRYTVPTISGKKFTRSLEGSSAVFLVTSVTAALLLFYGMSLSVHTSLFGALVIGISACLVEAVSPHGFDNFTVQFVSLIGAYYLLL
jgi:phytol kinase